MNLVPKIVIYYALYGVIASLVVASLAATPQRLKPVQPMNLAPIIESIRQV